MKVVKDGKHIVNLILIISFLGFGRNAFAQETGKFEIQYDSMWNFKQAEFIWQFGGDNYEVNQFPTKARQKYCNRHKKLIKATPTQKNHSDYYKLACALWECNRLPEAEAMFLKIIASNEPYYIKTYYHNGGQDDTATGFRGYGGSSSNYKNGSCRYLTQIYIKTGKFDEALKYLIDADKKYTIAYNCGTSAHWYRSEIKGLYGYCYEGLQKYDSVINMFLPDFTEYYNDVLIRALKMTYTKAEINDYLKIAEDSIVCVVDTFQSSSWSIHHYGEANETTTEIKYTSGTATTVLFGKEVTLPTPELKEGDKVTREFFVNNFKQLRFYVELTEGN